MCNPGVTVSNGGTATNYYGAGVSTTGPASSGDVALSGTGNANAPVGVSVTCTGSTLSVTGTLGVYACS